MSDPLTFAPLFSDSLGRASRVIVPSLPFAGLFVGAVGLLVWAAGVLPESGGSFFVFASLTLAALYAHSLFSASMYRTVLPGEGGLFASARKLTLAWLLVIVVAAIVGSIVVLFFSLIGASFGVVSGEAGQEITDMTAQMREGGTFWPLFAVFVATLIGLFWFAVRLILFASATAVRNQVHVFRTWYWTKGHFSILAPLTLIFIVVPIIALSLFAQSAFSVVFSVIETPLQAALAAAFVTAIQLPGAWLGHGFAASVFERLAPPDSA